MGVEKNSCLFLADRRPVTWQRRTPTNHASSSHNFSGVTGQPSYNMVWPWYPTRDCSYDATNGSSALHMCASCTSPRRPSFLRWKRIFSKRGSKWTWQVLRTSFPNGPGCAAKSINLQRRWMSRVCMRSQLTTQTSRWRRHSSCSRSCSRYLCSC